MHSATAARTTKPISLAPVSILRQTGDRHHAPKSTPAAPVSKSAAAAPNVIIVGRDDRDKAHASWFPESSAAAAREAAERMSMHAIDVDKANRSLADKLPAGKLFESGLAFVPFVKREVHDALLATVSVEERDRIEAARLSAAATKAAARAEESVTAHTEAPPILPGSLPDDWSKIKVNSVVLASVERADGWWEALVIEDKGDELLVLNWRGYTDWEPFLRRRDQLALLPPSYTGK